MSKVYFWETVLLCAVFCSVLPARYAVCSQENDPKYVYLTFDDGPLGGSEKIERVVRAEQVKINVFVVGKVMETNTRLQSYFELYRENPYIDVYNHSFSHADNQYAQYYKNPQGVLEDIIKNETLFRLPYKIVRLPGGNIWRLGDRKRDDGKECAAAADLLAAHSYTVVGWDLEWRHDSRTGAPIQSVAVMMARVTTLFETERMFTPGHLVLLLHDEMFRKNKDENQLKLFITALKQQGYILEHLRRYPDIAARQANALAKLYRNFQYKIQINPQYAVVIGRLARWLEASRYWPLVRLCGSGL